MFWFFGFLDFWTLVFLNFGILILVVFLGVLYFVCLLCFAFRIHLQFLMSS